MTVPKSPDKEEVRFQKLKGALERCCERGLLLTAMCPTSRLSYASFAEYNIRE